MVRKTTLRVKYTSKLYSTFVVATTSKELTNIITHAYHKKEGKNPV